VVVAQGNLDSPRPVRTVIPGYSSGALDRAEVGEVVVEVEIGPDGGVTRTTSLSGPPKLRLGSEAAASRWRFEPPGPTTARTARLVFDFIKQYEVEDPTSVIAVVVPPYRVEVWVGARVRVHMIDPSPTIPLTLAERRRRADAIRCDAFSYEPVGAEEQEPLATRVLRGVVRDPADWAMPGACLGLFSSGTRRLIAFGKAGYSGEFELGWVPPGQYRLVVMFPGFAPLVAPVTVRPDAPRNSLDIRLARASGARAGGSIQR